MDWTALRDDHPILAQTTYLNSCSLGALSRDAMEAHAAFLAQWNARGAASWYDHWLDEIADWRKNVARLLGCSPEEMAWGPSVSALVGSVASGLARIHGASRPDVVAYEQEFPTVRSCWGLRPGVRIRPVRSPDGLTVPTDGYADALATGSARALVASRVHYNSGGVQDVQALGRLAAANGTFSLIEDYHGTGQLPADVREWGVDAVVGGALKWLCGGMGSCFLYVRKERIAELEPQHAGWWANGAMFDFDNTGFRYWDDARRFEGGEVNMHGVAMANAAQKKILQIGVDRIRRRNVELVHDLLDRLADAGMTARVRSAEDHSALVMVERDDPSADVTRLERRHGIIVDHRPGAVRVSPHYYNTPEENEAFVAGLLTS